MSGRVDVRFKAGLTRLANGASMPNGIAGLVAQAETTVRLAKLHGERWTSRHLTYARPDASERARIAELYGPDIFPDGDE